MELQKAERKQKSIDQGRQPKALENVASFSALIRAQKLGKELRELALVQPTSKVAWKKVEEEISEIREEFENKHRLQKDCRKNLRSSLCICSWARKWE